jgi:hypothetical protein
MLEVAEADLKLGFVHVKAPQECRKSLAELVDANPRSPPTPCLRPRLTRSNRRSGTWHAGRGGSACRS